jgi:transcriptional regulator with XRE-family HTH domain
MRFGEYIKIARIGKQWNRAELARRLEITPQYLMTIEKENDKIPSEEIIERMVSILDLNEKEAFVLADKLPLRIIRQAKNEYYGGLSADEITQE